MNRRMTGNNECKRIDARKNGRSNVRDGRKVRGRGRNILAAMLVLCIIVAGITVLSGFDFRTKAADLEHPEEYKYYTSICIEKGDSLWSLAGKYMGEQYDSTQDYIEEVMELNQLSSEQLCEGQYLTVPYFSQDFR